MKRRIYSKIKYPFFVADTENVVLGFLKQHPKKNSIWLRYIEEVLYQGNKRGELAQILDYISHESTKYDLLKRLMQIDGYDPFTDLIPIEVLPECLQNLILKIRKKIS